MLPKLFTIGNFSLPTYGLLVATGVLLGLWISVRNSEKQGINPEHAWNLGIYVVLARVLTVYYFAHFIIILPLLGIFEKTKPLPNSISESVLGAKA